MRKIKLELVPDPDIQVFVEKGTKSQSSYISNRYKQELKHIIYLDANNLYGYVMPKVLPTSGFKWTDPKEFDVNKYTSNSSKGCVLEVDLDDSKELRELHNDYPFGPDKIEIKRDMLSEY